MDKLKSLFNIAKIFFHTLVNLFQVLGLDIGEDSDAYKSIKAVDDGIDALVASDDFKKIVDELE